MAKRRIIFQTAQARMMQLGLKRSEVARAMDISCGSLRNKMSGKTPFTLPEALRMKAVLGLDTGVEELFADGLKGGTL